jgi:hypothetical protein
VKETRNLIVANVASAEGIAVVEQIAGLKVEPID